MNENHYFLYVIPRVIVLRLWRPPLQEHAAVRQMDDRTRS